MEITAQLTGTTRVRTSGDQTPNLQTSKMESLMLIILDLPRQSMALLMTAEECHLSKILAVL